MTGLFKSIWNRFTAWIQEQFDRTDYLADIKLERQVQEGIIPDPTNTIELKKEPVQMFEESTTLIKSAGNGKETAEPGPSSELQGSEEALLIESEPETNPEAVKLNPELLERSKQKSITTRISAEDLEHAALCSRIDQMRKTWPDYDGSDIKQGDYPLIFDGLTPCMRLKEPVK